MSDELNKLKEEVADLKASISFWRRMVIAFTINIPIVAGTLLIVLGVGKMNNAGLYEDFIMLRTGGFILTLTNIVLLIGIDLYLILKD